MNSFQGLVDIEVKFRHQGKNPFEGSSKQSIELNDNIRKLQW